MVNFNSDKDIRLGHNTKKVSLRKLYLDPNNFRLIHEVEQMDVEDFRVKEKDVAQRTYRLILGDKNQHIQDLIQSFKENGYLPVDQIQVRELEDGGYVVVEGNRRVAALKYLQNEYEQKSIDLGSLDKDIFSRVPVVLYADSDKVHHLTLMGLKHISGNRKWGEWNQAKLLESLLEQPEVDENGVCKRLGITKHELRRSLRALGLANQYQQSDFGDQFSESMFPIFREAARNSALKEWLGWDDTNNVATDSENRELFFSWMSREAADDEDGLDFAGYADGYSEPAISRRDDISTLSKILKDSRALEQFKKVRDLNRAYQSSEIIFREKASNAVDAVVSDIGALSQIALSDGQGVVLEEALGKLKTIVEKARSEFVGGVEQRTLYYDRIDSHFESIKINSYKCLSGLELSGLRRVNVIAGVNNSGKTSLLEAIYLLCKQNDFSGVVEVFRTRGKIPDSQLPSKWLSDQLNDVFSVEGVFDGKFSKVNVAPVWEEQGEIDRSKYLKSIEISSEYEGVKNDSITRIHKGRDRETHADSIKLLSNVVFSTPFFLNEPKHYTEFYHRSVQSKLLPRVFQFIKNKIVPTLNDVRLVDEFQRFLVSDERFDSSVDISSYGEGLQRIFFTSLVFASASNGVVLIDEVENAIHADLIAQFIPFINELSKEFNAQVFVTSHSKECIDSFVNETAPHDVEDLSFHALVKGQEGRIVAKNFGGRDFSKILLAGDVDLRRAR